MSSSVNKVILVGNLGNDPEIRASNDGRELATFSIATTERWRDKNTNEQKERTEWHRVVVFSDGLVKVVKNYVKKGSRLYIEGALQTRKWTDNNGVEKYTTEVILQNFNSQLVMLDSRNAAGEGYTPPGQPLPPEGGASGGATKPAEFKHNEIDDNIPF